MATIGLGVEYGLPSGGTTEWTETNNGGPKRPGQSALIPSGTIVRQCTGTQTIKAPDIEAVIRICCGHGANYEQIWIGHHKSSCPTIVIMSPGLLYDDLLKGDGINMCWVEYQAVNSGKATPPGGGIEVQVTISLE